MDRDFLTYSRCDALPNVVSADNLSLARESEATTTLLVIAMGVLNLTCVSR